MKVVRVIFVLAACLLSACAGERVSPLFRQVRMVAGEGKLSGVLGEQELTAFQGLMRGRVGAGVVEVLTLEVDVPEGEGTEGNYLALVRREGAGGVGGGWELQYFEQSAHMPRADRAFHRALTAGEVGELEGFMKAHRLGEMWRGRERSEAASGEGVAGTQGAATGVAATRAKEGDEDPPKGGTPNNPPDGGTTDGDDEPLVEGVRVVFRITDARVDGGEMVVVESPRKGDHPVVDLLGMLKRFRDGGAMAARYFQTMPVTAKSMYADPYRRVLGVWEGRGEVRILVSGAVRPMAGAEEGGEEWLVYKEGKWVASEVPPELPAEGTVATVTTGTATTRPVTRSDDEPPKGGTTNGGAVVPVDVTVVRVSEDPPKGGTTNGGPPKGGTPNGGTANGGTAKGGTMSDPLAGIAWEAMRRATPTTWPSAEALVEEARAAMGVPGIFLEKETWWTVPERNATVVYHYVPVGEKAGLKFGFVVPAFKFDDGQFAVDGERGVMYVIHDGQLFSLPVPESALGREAVRQAKGG